MQWENSNLTINGVLTPTKVLNFAIDVSDVGGTIFANSNGLVPDPLSGELDPFNQFMFDRFDITVDQLEGEINLPYILERKVLNPTGNIFVPVTRIIVPHSLLGGFTQFRINYQYIYYPGDVIASGDIADEGFVVNDSIITPRTIVPRFTPPPPPPPPPVFTIDDGQIKEALADKIYEKFFNSDEIQADISDVLSLQTTTSEDGVGYETGRTSEDQQLIIFKKDRNTPENKRDFEGDGSDGIQAIANIISASLAGTDANGVVDLSSKLDDEISILRVESDSRISSVDTNYFDPPIPVTSNAPDIPKFYVQITKYTLKYSSNFQTIDVDFAELWSYYQQSQADDSGFDPKEPGMTDEWKNKLNLSQLTLVKPSTRIDSNKALATLDTNIFELLPAGSQRQIEINNFFDLFNQLIGTAPSFDDGNEDNVPETILNEQTDLDRRISTATDELYPQSFITRTDEDADEANDGKTLESMRNRLNQFLFDVDSVVEEVPDSRPEYENKSSGFLKLRRLNQSILIKGTGDTPSFGNWTEDGFTITMWVRFLNTTGGGNLFTYGNPMMRTKSSFRLETMTVQEGDSIAQGGIDYVYAKPRRVIRLSVWEDRREDPWWQERLALGGMDWASTVPWERRMGYLYDNSVPYDLQPEIFVDGLGGSETEITEPAPQNPPTGWSPMNPMIGTLSPQGQWIWNGSGWGANSNNNSNDPGLDSRGFVKRATFHAQMPASDMVQNNSTRSPFTQNFLQYTDVPTDDLEEWFFVCATYDPNVKEIASFGGEFGSYGPYGAPLNFHQANPNDDLKPGTLGFTNSNAFLRDELFWSGHKDQSNNIVSRSGFGNRCKVEIISRSDLLRARGYRV